VPVRLGLRGARAAEILEGLAEGDRVIPATSPINAGDWLRTQ
jgi:hypothetical protein